MVFDDEMDFELNENTTSKNTEPQLEKYGVWIKKGPETLESPQETTSEILDIPDVPDTTDFSDISVMDDDIISSENEQIESINDEINSLIDTNPVAEENSSIIDNSIEMPQIENDIIDTNIDIEHIFDEFYTSDISRTKGNTGLGLAIAKEFTEMLGGNISANKLKNKLIIKISFNQ